MANDEEDSPFPLLEGRDVPTLVFDNIDEPEVIGGMVRAIAWRWKRIGGQLAREQVGELIYPLTALDDMRRATDTAIARVNKPNRAAN